MSKISTVPVITLDGPSGTGKGTVSLLLAQKLCWHYLDSGAIYRVLAYGVMEQDISIDCEQDIVHLAENLPLSFEVQNQDMLQVFYNNENVTTSIREPICSQMASKLAAIPSVRQALLQRQRDFSERPGLVTDGRDMGTVVFPDASLKIFLNASSEERAKRRCLQLQSSGKSASLAQVLEEIQQRDTRDSERAVSPLKPAEDAVIIDTTSLTIVQVLETILQLVKARLKNRE